MTAAIYLNHPPKESTMKELITIIITTYAIYGLIRINLTCYSHYKAILFVYEYYVNSEERNNYDVVKDQVILMAKKLHNKYLNKIIMPTVTLFFVSLYFLYDVPFYYLVSTCIAYVCTCMVFLLFIIVDLDRVTNKLYQKALFGN